MDKIARQEKLLSNPSVLVDSSPILYNSANVADTQRVSMPPMFAFPSKGSENVENVMNSLFKALERCDSPDSVNVVADLTSGVGSSFSSAVIMDLKDNFPQLQIRSIFTLPKEDTIQGIGALNAMMTVRTSLAFADCVMLRTLDDAMSLAQEYSQSPTMQELNELIACDVLAAIGVKTVSYDPPFHYDNTDDGISIKENAFQFTCNQSVEEIMENVTGVGSFYCWPNNVCSVKNKIFDVRSSFWKLRRTRSQSKSRTGLKSSHTSAQYNPVRAMAMNLHALHLASSGYSNAINTWPDEDGICSISRFSEVSQASLSRICMQPTLQPKGHPRSILEYSDPYAVFSAPEVAVQVSLTLNFSILLASYFMWSGTSESYGVLLS